jgi:hypothetical protein
MVDFNEPIFGGTYALRSSLAPANLPRATIRSVRCAGARCSVRRESAVPSLWAGLHARRVGRRKSTEMPDFVFQAARGNVTNLVLRILGAVCTGKPYLRVASEEQDPYRLTRLERDLQDCTWDKSGGELPSSFLHKRTWTCGVPRENRKPCRIQVLPQRWPNREMPR